MNLPGSVFESYRDDVTGARVFNLTPGSERDLVTYQTHSMWSAAGSHLMFSSDGGGGMQPHALDLGDGTVRRLSERVVASEVLARKSDRVYLVSERMIYAVHLAQAGGEQEIADLPGYAERLSGGVSLDASEAVLFSGVAFEGEKSWGLIALDLSSGEWRRLVTVDFQVGHVQANPVRPGVVMFCHETGGDASQRMWVVEPDHESPRPFYKETYDEWVTHEAWWGADRAIFTIWPYDDAHRAQPHGILSADLATGTSTLHSQYPAWHTHGSPDRRWAVGDDFERNLWLVEIATGKRRLLTQGHNTKGFETHPHSSFTPDGKGVVFSSSRSGSEDVMMVEIPEWDSLPPAEG
jgi:oligogalacturonide lyase